MSKRRFEYQYRQVLVRMRQGDADRDIERSGLMGRKKLARLRKTALDRGWLLLENPPPEDAELAAVFQERSLPASSISGLIGYRDQIATWVQAGVAGTAIHAALVRTCFESPKRLQINRLTSVRMYCDSWLCHGREETQEKMWGTTTLPNRFEQQEVGGNTGFDSRGKSHGTAAHGGYAQST
jgi:hypothetical protein